MSGNIAHRLHVLVVLSTIGGIVASPSVTDSAEAVRHLGFASCAASTCHGGTQAFPDQSINQTEYFTWHREDPHAKAFTVLTGKRGQQIARALGEDNPSSAGTCLACHSNTAARLNPGPDFHVEEGIGCEACHGGASRWIDAHKAGSPSKAQRKKLGMYPTWEPRARAELCLSCHLGNGSHAWTHRLMSAGHPVLQLDEKLLSKWPQHFELDGDYRQRKPDAFPTDSEKIFPIVAARYYLARIESQYSAKGLFPESSLFRCSACHHRSDGKSLKRGDSMLSVPHAPPLDDATFDSVRSALQKRGKSTVSLWDGHLDTLRSGIASGNEKAVQRSTRAMQAMIDDYLMR